MGRSSRGMTLVEVVVALAVFSVSALALASMLFSTARLNEANRENTLAQNGAKAMVESMRNEEFAEIFRRFNDDPADDPEGAGTAPGANFAIANLVPIDGDADGRPGRIDFPTISGQLREDFPDPLLQMPRDLNGDGAVDSNNHAADYRILPVTVTVEWKSIGGRTRLVYRTSFVPK